MNDDNIKTTAAVTYGLIPVTVDSTRTAPYLQFACFKPEYPGSSVSGLAGAELPEKYSGPEENGPLFLVAFTVESSKTLTVSQFSAVFRPTVKSFPRPSEPPMVFGVSDSDTWGWDSEDADLSPWASPGAAATFLPGRQYVVATKPLPSEGFNDIPPGMLYFSIENPGVSAAEHNGWKIGILGATCRLKLQEPAR